MQITRNMNPMAPIQPLYDFSNPQEPVCLLQGDAELETSQGRHAETAQLLLQLQPVPRMFFHSMFRSNPGFFMAACHQEPENFIQSFSFCGVKKDGFPGKWGPGTEKVQLNWFPKELFIEAGRMQDKNTTMAIAHLFNFPNFRGDAHQDNAPEGCNIMKLESDEWQVWIQSLPGDTARNMPDFAGKADGSHLTHVVKLERKNRQPFSGQEAGEQFSMLENFLSFVCGARCKPVCAAGLNAKGEKTWQTFAPPGISRPVFSWFDSRQALQAETLFPLFAKKWNQSQGWKSCLRLIIGWYLQVNRAAEPVYPEAGIILAQVALERLEHEHAIDAGAESTNKASDNVNKKTGGDTKPKASGRRGKPPASFSLRKMFSRMEIPVTIPAAVYHLKEFSDGENLEDALHAITKIRNLTVHPEKEVIPTPDCLMDAWKLSLWFLEMSILATCGYKGEYRNRLHSPGCFASEAVPWAKGCAEMPSPGSAETAVSDSAQTASLHGPEKF